MYVVVSNACGRGILWVRLPCLLVCVWTSARSTHRLDVLEGVDGGGHEGVEGAQGHDGEDVGGVDDQGVLW